MKKLNVYAVGTRLFERLIIAPRLGCFLPLGFLRGWRRRAGNHPLQNVLEFNALQSQIFGLFRHKSMIAQADNLSESKAEIQSCRYKNCFSEDWTPFVATNQHWKSFCHPILELVSFWFGTSKYLVTLLTVNITRPLDICESRGRKFKSTWTRCISSMVLPSGGLIPSAVKKLNECNDTRYTRRSTKPNIGLSTRPSISPFPASKASSENPSLSFFQMVICAFRPESKLVNSSSMFVPCTVNHATAFISEIGQFRGSAAVIALFIVMFSWTSIAANTPEIPISRAMPNIKILQPHTAFIFARSWCPVKLEMCSLLISSSASFSIQSPKKTIIPPNIASSGISPAHEYLAEKENSAITMITIIAAINFVLVLIIGFAFLFRFKKID